MEDIKDMSAGQDNSYVLSKNGTAYVTGCHGRRQCRMCGCSSNTYAPMTVMSNVQSVSMGSSHGLVLTENGTLLAIGTNQYGELGDGTLIRRNHYHGYGHMASNVRTAFAGSSRSFYVTNDGKTYGVGRLDRSISMPYSSPVELLPGVQVKKIVDGLKFTLFLT